MERRDAAEPRHVGLVRGLHEEGWQHAGVQAAGAKQALRVQGAAQLHHDGMLRVQFVCTSIIGEYTVPLKL
jgi:hypothetical protein